MGATEPSQWQLRRGQYLGEISALCFLHLPANLSSLPLLLAGTGSQILVYDLAIGAPLKSFEVFEGIRVHGISLENFHKQLAGSAVSFRVCVYGERRVKLFTLRVEPSGKQEPFLHLELTLIHSLPKFRHWVMDVCFLKDGATASEDPRYLAIGCSDNYVYFWDISRYNMYSEVKCAERCLLYSMKMFGDDIDSLRIASGTIFNEVVVWKVICQNGAKQPGSHAEDHLQLNSDEGFSYPCPNYKDALISRLVGHEGSIFRIAWFSNGTKLVSVSDDRSARIWEVQAEKGISCNATQEQVNQIEGPVLFGHNARIWDCCIFESLIITAGEDCTCRVWDHHGRELKEIKEHIGRGVWRCLYDPVSSLLVTAGFDSAIKLHQICISNEGIEKTVASEDFSDRKEAFALSIPKSSSYGGLMDSKSEYVRCLNFSREDSLYVATNNGYLYHVNLCNTEAANWTELARISEEAPIICMDLLSKCSDTPDRCEDWIAAGDGKGRMTIAHAVGTGWKVEVEFTFTWPAEEERHLLGTYWCKLSEARFIFTADPGGRLKLWKLCHNSHSASLIDKGSYDVCLIAEYASCFGKRIMCLDASFDEELIVCGDIRGNLILFSSPRTLLSSNSATTEVKESPVNYFKGAHGVSSVNSVSISRLLSDEVDIRSTGADGCVCHFQYERDLQSMEFIGMKQVKELGAVRSVFTTDCCDDSVVSEYAVGFASDNFIIWNLTSGTKVQQITCGGWRRPHSYYLGHLPEMMNCFAFVKDDVIYVHRHWVPENNRKIYPQNLHLQFHGREIHSLCFIHEQSLCSQDENRGLVAKSSWLATGCEDGTVRLTRYELGTKNWSSSQHLGEHVGGSAVRSICAVSKMHVFMPDPFNIRNVVYRQNGIVNGRDPFILISVGAKRVVTAWKQTVTTIKNRVDAMSSEMNKNNENNSPDSSAATMSSLSFQWLSTDMPLRHNSNMKRQDSNNVSETPEDGIVTASNAIPCESVSPECRNTDTNLYPVDNFENDWRYLDVTAFIVKEAGSRFSVCFVIVACSDATVTLRALVLPFRLWFDVASLAPLSSPVLSLQPVVTPRLLSKENSQIGSFYLAITGSTDGSIAIWDLTLSVENFMRQIAGLKMENCLDFQKRPRTGRGSQGGRWWRSIATKKQKKRPVNCKLREKGCNLSVSGGRTESSKEKEDHLHETSMFKQSDDRVPLKVDNQSSLVSERKTDNLSPQISVVEAMQVLDNIHQSGVNCLFVSEIRNQGLNDSMSTFYVVSGGDDQAINCLRCDLELDPTMKSQNMNAEIHLNSKPVATNNCNHHFRIQNHQMLVTYLDKNKSAHSSAVKGVWTDGSWVFSVGLDQRVRCWNLSHDKLTECSHLIINVPEPESLDVKICGRNHYQIAVAGRGMQMIEFRPTN
ncbi:uncharacterized protein LOC121752004 isoform X1 [Salvia splendens]|uniref:uncharacterized protein LOC121752004 isoform X1 n=2 Tax=Salvia splendens TaxID=180675 RepID=UPI001C25DAF7|nr:uncharacterized protein LOC121752004 isoform X1 [Salvia splendens]